MKRTTKNYLWHDHEDQTVVDYGLYKPFRQEQKKGILTSLNWLPVAASLVIPEENQLKLEEKKHPHLVQKIRRLLKLKCSCYACGSKEKLLLFFLGEHPASMNDWPDEWCEILCKECYTKFKLGPNVEIRNPDEVKIERALQHEQRTKLKKQFNQDLYNRMTRPIKAHDSNNSE